MRITTNLLVFPLVYVLIASFLTLSECEQGSMQNAICTKFIDVHQNASPNLFYSNSLIIVILRVDLVNGRSLCFFPVCALNSVICKRTITTQKKETKLKRKEKFSPDFHIVIHAYAFVKFKLEQLENASNY